MLIGKARVKEKAAEESRAEFHKEVADVFCQTLLLVKFYGIDVEKEIKEKWLAWSSSAKQEKLPGGHPVEA